MSIHQQQVEAYWRDGFVVVPGVFTREEIDGVRSMIFRLYARFMPDDTRFGGLAEPWNDPRFDAAMCELRAREPKKFGALYDCAQGSLELLRFLTHGRAVDVAARVLGEPAGDLSFSGLMLRMDVPEDRRNVLTWHQDRAYYPQNYNDGGRGLVYSVALQDITEEMGALHFSVGSHRAGLIEPETGMKRDYHTTEQRAVPAEAVARYPEARGACRKGDVVLIHMDVFHRSGHNMSDRIRFSALFRYHRMLADDYVPFGLLYQYNPYMIDRAKMVAEGGAN
jgi:hypothetical protein